MTDLRTAAQQALEALQEYQSNGAPFLACDGAVAALRAALAQQAEPVQEPVAWLYEAGANRTLHWHKPPLYGTPLYAAPPQRKPLTEKEMYAVEEEARKNFRLSQKGPRGQQITYWDGLTPWLIRAVERAHGIKE